MPVADLEDGAGGGGLFLVAVVVPLVAAGVMSGCVTSEVGEVIKGSGIPSPTPFVVAVVTFTWVGSLQVEPPLQHEPVGGGWGGWGWKEGISLTRIGSLSTSTAPGAG